jgi:hypothetical protein
LEAWHLAPHILKLRLVFPASHVEYDLIFIRTAAQLEQ